MFLSRSNFHADHNNFDEWFKIVFSMILFFGELDCSLKNFVNHESLSSEGFFIFVHFEFAILWIFCISESAINFMQIKKRFVCKNCFQKMQHVQDNQFTQQKLKQLNPLVPLNIKSRKKSGQSRVGYSILMFFTKFSTSTDISIP